MKIKMPDVASNFLSVEDTIKAIRDARNQKEAAKIYFFEVIQDSRKRSVEICSKVNEAIRQRWPKGLNRVKELAWTYGERKWS